MDESMIITMASFSFRGFIDGKWKLILSERNEQSNVLKTVDFSRTEFISGLCKEDKEYAEGAGEVKLCRLKENGAILYGASVFAGLWKNYKMLKRWSVLECLFRNRGIDWMSFFGDIFLDPISHKRCVLVLRRFDRDGGEWRRDVYWLNLTWSVKHVTAVSSQ